MPTLTWSVQSQWPPLPRHVGDARRFAADRLASAHLEQLVDVTSLIVSELASNAVRHAQTPFRLTVECHGTSLLIEVHDDSSEPAAIPGSGTLELDGRGLSLVREISDGWGVIAHAAGGKSVWATVNLEGAAQRLTARPA